MFADIIIDITHEKLDKVFQYRIPPELEGVLQVGMEVIVPFGKGNKETHGYVIGFSEKADYDLAKIKEVLCIEENHQEIESKLIALAAWVREYYGGTMIQALKTVLPIKKKERIQHKRKVKLLLNEEEGSFLRDGSEFSTAMNACGRNRKEAIGVDIIKGDRLVALDALEEVSKTHKYNLATSISKVADNYHSEIIELDNFQYFDCSDFDEDIASNIIGTITGMVLGYCNWKKPILGFSKPKNNQIKVSLRCSKLLAYDGIHFGNMIREIAKEVGGTGGGHAIACGAYIPNEKKSEFLDKFNRKLQGKIAN